MRVKPQRLFEILATVGITSPSRLKNPGGAFWTERVS
jgi:hypothetical protein